MTCLAGIETEVKSMLEHRRVAEDIAAKARVRALDAQTRHGHVYVLVDGWGWIKSSDLLRRVEIA
jgi:hypothetical protein